MDFFPGYPLEGYHHAYFLSHLHFGYPSRSDASHETIDAGSAHL